MSKDEITIPKHEQEAQMTKDDLTINLGLAYALAAINKLPKHCRPSEDYWLMDRLLKKRTNGSAASLLHGLAHVNLDRQGPIKLTEATVELLTGKGDGAAVTAPDPWDFLE